MKIVLAALAGLVLITTPGLAQESTSVFQLLDRARAAHASGNAREAERLAEQAVAAASSPSERFNALVVYGDLLTEAGDHRNAYELYHRVLELVEEHDPENIDALDMALGRAGAAAMMLGYREEWIALSARKLDLHRTAQEPLWRFEESAQVRHRLSGYPCPEFAHGLIRQELIAYNVNGTDVSCRYTPSETPGPPITAHAFLTGADHESAYRDGLAGMLRNFTGARRVEEGESEIGGVPVRYGIYRQSDITAGVWTTQVGGWTLKLRITHQGEMSREQMNAAAGLAFAGARDVERHIGQCDAALTGTGRLGLPTGLDDGLRLAVALIASGAGEAEDGPAHADPDPLQCFLGTVDFRPSGGTSVARIDDNGHLLDYRAYPRGSTDIYIEASPLHTLGNDLSDLVEGSEVASGRRWTLLLTAPDHTRVYGEFDGAPSPDAFREAVNGILDGTIPAIANLVENADGNLEIQLAGPASQEAGAD